MTAPVLEELICGGVGGALAVACTHPLDTIKTRAQAGLPSKLGPILRAEGVAGLYRGFAVPIVSQPLYIGGCFAGVALGRKLYDSLLAPSLGGGGADGGSVPRFLFAGALGGVACATAVTPGERLKVLMQAQTGGGASQGLVTLTLGLLKRGGLPALFTGLPATIAREIPGTIIWFGMYEAVSQHLERALHIPRPLAVVVGGLAAGTSFWLSTLPIDRIKTMQQASPAGVSPWHLAQRVWRTEGARGFYVGIGPALVRGLMLDVVQFSVADALRRRLQRGRIHVVHTPG